MNLFNIEAGPWGGLILILFLIAAIAAIYFTGWIVSGLLLIVIVIVPLAFLIYYAGKRANRRLVHGRRKR